jgi:hypothetical protein
MFAVCCNKTINTARGNTSKNIMIGLLTVDWGGIHPPPATYSKSSVVRLSNLSPEYIKKCTNEPLTATKEGWKKFN